MEWEKIGQIGVDAGICWIGDPCYILHTKLPAALGKNWNEFVQKLYGDNPNGVPFKQFGISTGVVVSTGHGDGIYPVEIRRENGVVKEVRVIFVD